MLRLTLVESYPNPVWLWSTLVESYPNPVRFRSTLVESSPTPVNSGRIQSESGPTPVNSGRIQSESGPTPVNSGRIQSESGPTPVNSGRIQSESGPDSGRTPVPEPFHLYKRGFFHITFIFSNCGQSIKVNDYDGVVCDSRWTPWCQVEWMAVLLIVVVVMLDQITEMICCLISVARETK